MPKPEWGREGVQPEEGSLAGEWKPRLKDQLVATKPFVGHINDDVVELLVSRHQPNHMAVHAHYVVGKMDKRNAKELIVEKIARLNARRGTRKVTN